MLVAISLLRTSGVFDIVTGGIKYLVGLMHIDTGFVDALPTALIKPLSGSGARGMMIDTMKVFGPDSFAGRLSCVFQGSSDTTFYVIAVYFGAVGVKKYPLCYWLYAHGRPGRYHHGHHYLQLLALAVLSIKSNDPVGRQGHCFL